MYGMNVEQKNTKSQLSNYSIYYQISITNSTVSSTSSCELPCENSQNISNRPTWPTYGERGTEKKNNFKNPGSRWKFNFRISFSLTLSRD